MDNDDLTPFCDDDLTPFCVTPFCALLCVEDVACRPARQFSQQSCRGGRTWEFALLGWEVSL